jgi:hypothetical protein
MFAIIFFTRYIGIGWIYANRALFFIVVSLLVISGGLLLEWLRKRFLAKMKEGGDT